MESITSLIKFFCLFLHCVFTRGGGGGGGCGCVVAVGGGSGGGTAVLYVEVMIMMMKMKESKTKGKRGKRRGGEMRGGEEEGKSRWETVGGDDDDAIAAVVAVVAAVDYDTVVSGLHLFLILFTLGSATLNLAETNCIPFFYFINLKFSIKKN